MYTSCSDSFYDITCMASARHEKVKGLMLSYGTVVLVPNARCLASMTKAQPGCSSSQMIVFFMKQYVPDLNP